MASKKYTDEMKKFISDNCSCMTIVELTDTFNAKFNTDFEKSELSSYLIYHKLNWAHTRLKILPIHTAWLTDNFFKYDTTVKLTIAFNNKFNSSCTPEFIGKKCKTLGFSRNNCLPYTERENNWLIQNANSVPYSELAIMFKKVFKRDVTKSALQQHCIKALDLYSDDRYKFVNKVPWNKKEIYAESIDSRGNRIIKIDKKNRWINKARFIYEQAYGKVPKGYCIIQLDGNKENFELDNLYCLPLKYHTMMGRNHWFGKGKEITLTAIKLCELNFAMKG